MTTKPLSRSGKRAESREFLFRVSVWLKGLHAGLEIAGGVALFAVSPGFIIRAVALLTQDELAEDPHDLIANYLLNAATHFSVSSKQFVALYLLAHGVPKILLVVALLRHQLWAYPLAIIAFGAFILYQLYRFTFKHSIGLIALSVFDLAVIWLIWLEYRALKVARPSLCNSRYLLALAAARDARCFRPLTKPAVLAGPARGRR